MKNNLLTLLLSMYFIVHIQGQTKKYTLDFNAEKFALQNLTLNGKSIKVRAFEKIVYVQNPIDTTYQILNIYIPDIYFSNGKINGYTKDTAPIFFPNQVGGYMPAKPASTSNDPFGGMLPLGNGDLPKLPDGEKPPMPPGGIMGMPKRESAILVALSKGYVVASAGARGRTTKNAEGFYTGKAPAAIVDLKAAIRYLKFNDKRMLGDANKIISNGTSAGGAMSTLLGATGNNSDYEPYLKEIGAAAAKDDIFAVSAYCPIINLENADAAYEWQFFGINEYQKMNMGSLDYHVTRTETPSSLSDTQIKISEKLKSLFPKYINSLHLKDIKGTTLTLDIAGNGNFKELVKSYVIASAQTAYDTGTDMSKLNWLTIKDKKVIAIDFDAYLRYLQRQKTPPAFDAVDLSSGENQEFGTAKIDKQHFTKFSSEESTAKGSSADPKIVSMMNPMDYIGTDKTTTSPHWRVRHGTKDKDTGLAIPVILGTYLLNKGYNVDFELPWDKPHSGDYDLDELFSWVDKICR